MNSKKTICLLSVLIGISSAGYSDTKDSLGLQGDNLDLYGVMELFKKSESPEAFEAALNKEDSKLNNLDLNGDGETDYIRVVDQTEGDAHAFVLQVPVNETEAQDVAVIEVEKNNNETAHVQIVGDEDLYGKDYIIEPAQEETEVGSAPPPQPVISTASNPPVIVNVWAWPCVNYVYGPRYKIWVSPWRWRSYPIWWKPWRPMRWHAYYGYVHPYHVYHHRVYVHRVEHAHAVYYGHRVVSKTVYQRRVAAPMARPAQGVRQERRAERQQAPRGQRAGRPNRAQQQQQPRQHRGPRK